MCRMNRKQDYEGGVWYFIQHFECSLYVVVLSFLLSLDQSNEGFISMYFFVFYSVVHKLFIPLLTGNWGLSLYNVSSWWANIFITKAKQWRLIANTLMFFTPALQERKRRAHVLFFSHAEIVWRSDWLEEEACFAKLRVILLSYELIAVSSGRKIHLSS